MIRDRSATCRSLVVVLAAVLAAGALPARTMPLEGQPSRDSPSARTLADSLGRAVTEAALRGETGRLRELVAVAEEARAVHPDDPRLRHCLGYALYRLGTAEMERGPEAADATLTRAQRVLEASAREDSVPESFALAALTAGMRIAAEPRRRARTLGPKIGRHFRAAEAAGPDNPRVWLLRGVNAFHSQAEHGGGAQRARRFLRKALSLFGRDGGDPETPGWGRAEAHAWLGQIHARAGDDRAARAEFRKALEIAPGYAWVEEELLPAVAGDGEG